MHRVLYFLDRHLLEIGFAGLFAAIFDLFSPDSRLRRAVRYVKNKWSERSAKDLRKRIEQLEWYRNGLSSDKGLYLITLRFLLLLLTMVSAGLFVLSSREITGIPNIQVEGAGLASVAFGVLFWQVYKEYVMHHWIRGKRLHEC